MLFRQKLLDGIRDGKVTLAFRRWRRPSVRAGGTLLTPVGLLQIQSVIPVTLEQISAADAQFAGYGSLEALLSEFDHRQEGKLYRIELGCLRPDSRIALRESLATDGSDVDAIVRRLKQLDAKTHGAPWTLRTLEAVRSNPGVRAGDLCERVGQQKEQFKLNVRKLKNLGLTVSLGTGYRLSPRGAALFDYLYATAAQMPHNSPL
jgi:hypothetical protein